MIAHRALPFVTLALLGCFAACLPVGEEADARVEPIGTARSAVINGTASDASQDAVVLLVHYDPKAPSRVGTCTGTLLSPRLVLTARHCVGDTDRVAACKADGTPVKFGAIRGNHKANTLLVFTGQNRPDFKRGKVAPAGTGMTILDDGGENLCNHDIALVVLEEPILNVPIAPVRLETEISKGELITAVGWGVTEDTAQPSQRQQRTNVKVTKVGVNATTGNLPPNEFEVGESICSGDSGGPAFAQETRAVIGVVSRGGNAQAKSPDDPASGCIAGSNMYTKLGPFKDLILRGYELAEAEPWLEGGMDPRKLKPAVACTSADECRSNLCLPDPAAADETTCAEDCSATATCTVAGDVCTPEGDAPVCRTPKPKTKRITTTSCSGAPSAPASSGAGASFLFGLLVLASLRKKRRSFA